MQPSTQSSGRAHSRFSALRHPQFLKYWLASFTSVGATQLQVMGLGWLVYEISGSTLALGYLGAAAGLPAILTSLFGGVLADRMDKRGLLIITSILTAALLGLLAWLDYTGVVEVWHVIAIAAAISIITGFDWPVRQAIFPALIDREDMMSAVALTTVIWQATRMTMPALGGILIALVDTWLVFVFCSAGFFIMFLVLLNLKIQSVIVSSPESTLRQITQGVQYILHNRVFLVLITLSYALFFLPTAYLQLMPAFADLLGTDETGYGYLLSIGGIGAVTGTFISGALQHSHRLGRIMMGSTIIFCGFVYLFAWISQSGLAYALYLALATVFTASIFSSIFMITSTTVLQLEVPDNLRGRVMGFHAITYNLFPLGALFAGWTASYSNAAWAIAVSTSIFLVYVVWILVAQRDVTVIDGRELTDAHQAA